MRTPIERRGQADRADAYCLSIRIFQISCASLDALLGLLAAGGAEHLHHLEEFGSSGSLPCVPPEANHLA